MPNQLINMEVIKDYIVDKLGNDVKFMPLTKVEPINEQAGTIRVLKEHYIGDAEVVAPGQPIPISDFDQSAVNIDIIKKSKALKFTQEDLLSMAGNPAQRIAEQLLRAANNGLDKALRDELAGVTGAMVVDATTVGKITVDVVADALQKFGENQGASYLFVNPATLTQMRKEEGFALKSAEGGINIVGEIFGANVVLSESVLVGEAYLIKEGALELYLRKEPVLKNQEDILTEQEVFTSNVYFAAHLADESKAVKIDLAV